MPPQLPKWYQDQSAAQKRSSLGGQEVQWDEPAPQPKPRSAIPLVDPAEIEATTNLVRGIGQTLASKASGLYTAGAAMSDTVDSSGLPDVVQRGVGVAKAFQRGAADYLSDTAKASGYKPTSFDDAVSDPLGAGRKYIGEQLTSSALNMAALAAVPQAYVPATLGEAAAKRAENDGREGQAGARDLLKVLPGTGASIALDRFGIEQMFGAPAKEAAKRGIGALAKHVGMSAGVEGATEATQQYLEDLSTDLGTKRGFDINRTNKAALEAGATGALLGAGFGGVGYAAQSPAKPSRRDEPVTEFEPPPPEPGQPRDLLALPDYSSAPAARPEPFYVDSQGNVGDTPDIRSEAMAAAPEGAQMDLFTTRGVAQPSDGELIGLAPTEAPAQPQAGPDLFTRNPTAATITDFGPREVLQRLRAANAAPDGTVGSPDSYTLKTANEISRLLQAGDDTAVNDYLAQADEKLQTSSLGQAALTKRLNVLQAATQAVQDFRRSRMQAFADEARMRQPAQPVSSQTPVPAPADGVEAIAPGEGMFPGREPAPVQGLTNEDVNEIVDNRLAKDAGQRRMALLQQVLDDPETRNPMRRFINELRKNKIKDLSLTADEVATIEKFEDAREAFGNPDVIPSAPDESDNFGIRERGAPKAKTLREAPAQPVAAPAPTDPALIERANQVAAERSYGSTQKHHFMKGVEDAAAGREPVGEMGPTSRAYYDAGREFVAAPQAEAVPARPQLSLKQPAPKSEPAAPATPTKFEPRAAARALSAVPRDDAAYEDVSDLVEKAFDSKRLSPLEYQQFQVLIDQKVLSPVAIKARLREALTAGKGDIKRRADDKERGVYTPEIVDLTPEFTKSRDKVYASLRDELDRLGLRKVGLRFMDEIDKFALGDNTAGYYANGVIGVALEFDDKQITLHHESIHALKGLGLFTRAEWQTLTAAARRDRPLHKWVKDNYAELPEEAQLEELVAERFARWMADKSKPTPERSLFKRILNFFRAVKAAFTKNGFADRDAVFERIAEGEIGDRANDLERVPFRRAGPGMPDQELAEAMGRFRKVETAEQAFQDGLVNTKFAASKFTLRALTLHQLVEQFSSKLKNLAPYYTKLRESGTRVQEIANSAHELLAKWNGLPNQFEKDEVGALLQEATFNQVNPRYAPDAGPNKGMTDEQRAVHTDLVKRYRALSPEAQGIFRAVLDKFSANLAQKRALFERMVNANEALDERQRRAQLAQVDSMFKRVKVYFPLMRFGDHVVVAASKDYLDAEDAAIEAKLALEAAQEQGDEKAVSEARKALAAANAALGEKKGSQDDYIVTAYETVGQAQRAADSFKEQGMNVRLRTKQEYERALDAVSPEFMRSLESNLSSVENGAELIRLAKQVMFQTLPENHALKAGLKRMNVAGFSTDARRTFAAAMTRDAYYLAKLEFGHETRDLLDTLSKEAKNSDDYTVQDAMKVIREHHASALEYKSTPIQDAVSNLAFIWYLGASPANLVINSLQTPIVTGPMLAARFGLPRAAAELTKAVSDVAVKKLASFTGGLGSELNLADVTRDAGELQMLETLLKRGVIDRTQGHDLVTYATNGNQAYRTMMKASSWMMHHTEVVNRIATALAAYRLANSEGATDPVEFADKIVTDSHFDYSADNAPLWYKRFPLAKVALQFKKYQQAMVYTLVNNFKTGFLDSPDITPEEKTIARNTFAGLMLTHGVAAGALGVPGAGILLAVADVIASLFDKDEPFDARSALQQFFADAMSAATDDPEQQKYWGQVFSRGLPMMFGTDLSSRVGAGDIFNPVRLPKSDATGRQAWYELVASALGPAIGVGGNFYQGAQQISDGQTLKGIETMLPKFLRDVMRSARLGTEGMTDSQGRLKVDAEAFSLPDLISQAFGLTPGKLSQYYDRQSATQGAKSAIQDRRQRLLREYAQAKMDQDPAAEAEALAMIEDFNAARDRDEPKLKINRGQMLKSLRARENYREDLVNGTRLTDRERGLGQYGDFAPEFEEIPE